jgi:hypothetical protein
MDKSERIAAVDLGPISQKLTDSRKVNVRMNAKMLQNSCHLAALAATAFTFSGSVAIIRPTVNHHR